MALTGHRTPQAPFILLKFPELSWPSYLLCKNSTNLLHEDRATIPGGEATWVGDFLASADGVTQAGGTTFLHINFLARLNGTTVSLASVM